MNYVLRARLSPTAIFGLPDGDKIVVPIAADNTRTFISPVMDPRTGKIKGHGTLPDFRKPQEAIDLRKSAGNASIELRDNFVSVTVEADDVQEALDLAAELLDRYCQCLSLQVGQRVSVIRDSLEDSAGNPQTVYTRKTVQFFSATVYDLKQLHGQLEVAFDWATALDDRARKALFYFEHAQLLEEFSKTLPLHSPHAAFSFATAFLQMFKGLVTIVGEPGVDSDHQRRARQLGLGADFWAERVQPLCKVRNDNDVAHYSLENPDLIAAGRQFSAAAGVFRDAFSGYMLWLARGR